MRIRIFFGLLLSLFSLSLFGATEEILMESSAPLSSPVFDFAGQRVAFVAEILISKHWKFPPEK